MGRADQLHLERFVATLPERARSFAERGATVPFTTPALAAARLRGIGTGAAELLLPAPGGRGTCVLDWQTCLDLAPTLHDRDLWRRLAGLPRATPGAVRAAARASALTGLAGRAAQAAARSALAAEAAARGELERHFAAHTPMAPLLAAALAETGTDGGPGTPLASRLDALARFAEAANAAALGPGPAPGREAARLVASAARLALAGTRAALAALVQAAQAVQAGEAEAAPRLLALADRPDWLLDGWDLPAALHDGAEPAWPTLGEVLAGLAPPAQEAEGWWSSAGGWEAVLDGRARLAPPPAAPAALRCDLVPRLEAARAVAA